MGAARRFRRGDQAERVFGEKKSRNDIKTDGERAAIDGLRRRHGRRQHDGDAGRHHHMVHRAKDSRRLAWAFRP